MRKSAPVLGVAFGLLFFSGVAAAASAIAEDPSTLTQAIHERVELVRAGKPLTIGGEPIVSRLILPRFSNNGASRRPGSRRRSTSCSVRSTGPSTRG